MLRKVPHLLRFPNRHLHEIHQLVRRHHQMVLHLDSEFSLDSRAHCSAISVSRLLTVLRRITFSIVHIVGLCRLHFSVPAEIESVIFEIDWNDIVPSIPFRQFLEVISHFLTIFCCSSESCIHRYVRGRNPVVLCTRFLPHCTKLCATTQNFVHSSESSVQRSRQSVFNHQESIHHWQYDRIFHLLLHLLLLLDRRSMGMCSLQLLCPGSSSPIQTASD